MAQGRRYPVARPVTHPAASHASVITASIASGRIPPLGIGLLRLVPEPAQPCPRDDRPNQLKTQPAADPACVFHAG